MSYKKYVFFIIILICIIIIVGFIYPSLNYLPNPFVDHFTVFPTGRPVLVISRYSEKIQWLNDDYASSFFNIIYNKGDNNDYYTNANTIQTIRAANLGRCDGTYARFIVDHYDNLPEVTVFATASSNMDSKINKLIKVLNTVKENELQNKNKSVFIHYKDGADLSILYNFQLDEWSASNSLNKNANNETKLTPAKIRPYGKWYEHHFGSFEDKYPYGSLWGIFAVSKTDVLKRPKEFYQDLLEQLEVSSNPEVGHYCERCWSKIFNYDDN